MEDFNNEHIENVVIGAGIEGSATAYWLAKHGYTTLLLEQFRLPHTRGSSHGGSRITRRAYEDEIYVKMADDSFKMWSELEGECGEQLYRKIGLLALSPQRTNFVQSIAEAMAKHKMPFETLTGTQIRQKFLNVQCDSDWIGLIDESGGLLRADRCLAAFQKEFQKFGGTLKENTQVTKLHLNQDGTIKIEARSNRKNVVVTCKKLIICAGPWTGSLLEQLNFQLPLQPKSVKICYWKEQKNQSDNYSAPGSNNNDNLPVILSKLDDENVLYAIPPDEYPGLVKVGFHLGAEISHPDQRDSVKTDHLIDVPRTFIKNHMKNLSEDPAIIESCIYTDTPDEDFILDILPLNKNVIIGAGFSGHGFKFAPVVGKILGSLAIGQDPNYDLSKFSCNRFNDKKASS